MSEIDVPIAVVGAGFSGTMTALHLLGRTNQRPVLLCERQERFARGTAYATGDPGHLLNVRASNMSALPDQPDDFVRWLETAQLMDTPEVRVTAAGAFVSRRLYGRYLSALLGNAVTGREGASRLILTPDEVVDLVPEEGGYRLVLAGGRTQHVAGVVLAIGNLLPAENPPGPCIDNPWAGLPTEDLRPGEPVVVVGSGLTMVDVTLMLRHAGFGGPVIAISRRGLLPHVHAATRSWPTPVLSVAERTSPARLLARVRAEVEAAAAAGIGWHSVVDSLRPITSDLWRGLDPDRQQRFLCHARPWWDVHRHRMAPPVGRQIEAFIRSGFLEVRAGCVDAVEPAGDRATVTWRPRGGSERRVITAQRVVNATGAAAPDRAGNPLVRQLIARRLARLDRNRLGLDLAPDLAVLGCDGRPVRGLWALGPLGQGVFWECTAVPDIRQQAVRVAEAVAAALQAETLAGAA